MNRLPGKRVALIVLACAVLGTSGCGKGGSSGSADALAPTGPLSDRVAALVEPLIEDGWAHGLMVGVVQNGRESYFPFGSLNDEANTSIDKNTVFEIGSITKVFTALALADMAVKEELSIDDAAEKWLPDEWNVATNSGEPITLKGLAAHISGLPVVPANFWNDGENTFDGDLGGRRWAEYSQAQLQNYFADPKPPLGEPGKYLYSNLGAGLLGHVLSTKTGVSLDSLIEKRICAPLGMSATSFDATPSGPGHDVDGNHAAHWPAGESVLRGAFALRSSCADMLKLAAATLEPERTPLKDALTLSLQPCATINELEKSALGWKLNKFGVIYTTGATGGFRCAMYLHPQSKTGVVLMANTQVGGVTGGRGGLFDALGGSLLNVTLGAQPLEIEFPSAAETAAGPLNDFAGGFVPEDGSRDPSFPIRLEDGKLMTLGPGGGEQRLWPLKEDTFFLRAYISKLRFLRNADGDVTGCELSFEGRTARLKKETD